MGSIDVFKTRGRANDGIRISLAEPDGKPTEHWLQIRSVWSDEYQAARSELIRQAVEDGKRLAGAKPEEVPALRRDAERRRRSNLASSLVAGWSFDLEFNQEAVADFLNEAPQILDHVEKIAEDDRRFFAKGSASSSNGAKPS